METGISTTAFQYIDFVKNEARVLRLECGSCWMDRVYTPRECDIVLRTFRVQLIRSTACGCLLMRSPVNVIFWTHAVFEVASWEDFSYFGEEFLQQLDSVGQHSSTLVL